MTRGKTLEDSELLRLLKAAIERGDVDVRLDTRRQHHIDSPLYREGDSSLWLYGSIGAVLASLYFFGWKIALAVMAVAAAFMTLVVRRFVAARMRRRFRAELLEKPEDFRKAWRLKGIGFCHKASGELCESPDGLWKSFVLNRCAAPSTDAQPTT